MPSFSEMNYKVNISIGMLMFIVVSTYMVATFYNNQRTLESRMDKRHKRTSERIDAVVKDVEGIKSCECNVKKEK